MICNVHCKQWSLTALWRVVCTTTTNCNGSVAYSVHYKQTCPVARVLFITDKKSIMTQWRVVHITHRNSSCTVACSVHYRQKSPTALWLVACTANNGAKRMMCTKKKTRPACNVQHVQGNLVRYAREMTKPTFTWLRTLNLRFSECVTPHLTDAHNGCHGTHGKHH